MIRYINYVLTAILVMLILPFAPFLAVAVIPVAFIYQLIEPREKIWQEFSFRRMVRSIGFKPPKKALAVYIFWLYVHLVFLGAFSSGIFNPNNFVSFWPFASDISVYDITEFMVYTGPPLFFILIYGMSRNEVAEDELAFSEDVNTRTYQAITPTLVEPVSVPVTPVRPLVDTFVEDEVVVDRAVAEVAMMETPVYSDASTSNQELLRLIQRQQERLEMMDAELQSLKMRMKEKA